MLVSASLDLGFAMFDAFSGFMVMWFTFDADEALCRCNHLGCIFGCQVACVPFPFSAPRDAMLTMLVCATRWLSMHFYMLAYMFMHESSLLVCHPCFNTMKLWTFDPNLHLSLTNTTFFCSLLVCLFVCLFAFLLLCLPWLSCLSTLCLFHAHFAHFPSIACLLVSCLCLCIYAHGVRILQARAWSPKHKQKGHGREHVDIS